MEKLILEHLEIIGLIICLVYEIICRLLRTKVDISLVNAMKELFDISVPNRKVDKHNKRNKTLLHK